MKKEIYYFLLTCIVMILLANCAGTGYQTASATKPAGPHSQLTEQEKLTPCSSCHKEVTPDIYQQWYDSRHGLDEIKCFQCHGTYENLKVSPDETTCAACHNAEFQHNVKGKTCWSCHPAHGFTVHK